jgi:quinol monooxygenase YgiN
MTLTLSPSNVIATVRIKVRPHSVSKMRVIARDLILTSRAEDGCLLYQINESVDDETQFFIYMVWRDERSYRNHAASPYVRAFDHEIACEIVEKRAEAKKWHALG